MKSECESKGKLLRVAMQLISESSYGSVSVEDICRQAGVKKGSFYHFFPSKSDLTVAAIEADWQSRQTGLDSIFSPQTPPLERLGQFCENAMQCQVEKKASYGKICGCPMLTLGAELSTQDEKIRLKTMEIVARYVRYLESAVREATAEGRVDPGDPHEAALALFAHFQGTLLQAKIQNDPAPLLGLNEQFLRLLQVHAEPALA